VGESLNKATSSSSSSKERIPRWKEPKKEKRGVGQVDPGGKTDPNNTVSRTRIRPKKRSEKKIQKDPYRKKKENRDEATKDKWDNGQQGQTQVAKKGKGV